MSQKKKILMIDDDPAVTEYMEMKLAREYVVVSLNDPEDAAEAAVKERPDLIICDIDMPEMDGGEVRRLLLENQQTKNIPFLFLTSIVTAKEAEGLGGYFGDHPGVSKHAPIEEILKSIKSAIGG